MISINFFVMRHPEHKDNVLTAAGVDQIIVSADLFLKDIKFDLAVHSELPRSRRTVEVVLDRLNQTHISIIEREVGFSWALSDPELPPYADPDKRPDFVEAQKKIFDLRGQDPRNHLVSDWFENCPKTFALRGSMRTTMLDLSRELNRDASILIGSHSPTGELAALHPRQTRCLGFADIIHYKIEKDHNSKFKIVSSRVLD